MTPATHTDAHPDAPPDDAAQQRRQLIDWFMRRQGPSWTQADESAFLEWLADPAHHRAYTQWQADWALVDAMPRESTDRLRALVAADRQAGKAAEAGASNPARNRFPERRRMLASGFAMAAVAGMAVTGGWLGWQHVQSKPLYEQAFTTPRGQQSEVRLPDGSTLRLDTATSVKAALFRRSRELQLLEGQAVFSVAPDAERPFRVTAAGVHITAIGTRFSVRLTPGVPGREAVEVAVEEGRVRVARPAVSSPKGAAAPQDAAPQAFELGAGQKLVLPSDGLPPRRDSVPADAFAPWRSAQLSFSDVPLKQALAEMERYADLGIGSVEPAAADLRLTGTFQPRDAAAVRRVLGNALPIRLEPGENGLEVRLAR